MTTEKRFSLELPEYRAAAEGSEDLGTVEGYAALFNSKTVLWEGKYYRWEEVIEPGAFDDVMNDDVCALFNHDFNKILARTSSGTLTIAKDDKGLKYSFSVPDTTVGRDLRTLLKRKDVSGSSFQFLIKDAVEEKRVEGEITVYLTRIQKLKRLIDVAPAVNPAYKATTSKLRSEADFEEMKKRLEAEPPQGESNPNEGQGQDTKVLLLAHANRARLL